MNANIVDCRIIFHKDIRFVIPVEKFCIRDEERYIYIMDFTSWEQNKTEINYLKANAFKMTHSQDPKTLPLPIPRDNP